MVRFSGPKPFEPKMVPGSPHLVTAWGIAAAYKNTGLGGGAPDKAAAEIELYTDGNVEVRSSSAELGQGLPTVLQLIAAEELAISPDSVRVLLSDTDLTPDGGPTTASRQTYVTGNAVRQTTAAFREMATDLLAGRHGVAKESVRWENGRVFVNGSALTLGRGSCGTDLCRQVPSYDHRLQRAGDQAAW